MNESMVPGGQHCAPSVEASQRSPPPDGVERSVPDLDLEQMEVVEQDALAARGDQRRSMEEVVERREASAAGYAAHLDSLMLC